MRDPIFNVRYKPIDDWSEVFGFSVSNEESRCLDLARSYAMHYAFVVKPGYRTIFDYEDEWDVCCVLDACRYETFEELNWIEGKLEKIISPAWNTKAWLERTFADSHPDLIIVTANAWYTKILGGEYLDKEVFHYEPCWKDHWHPHLCTVLPEDLTDVAIALHKEHPDKKLLIHYLQPHAPFIATSNLKLESDCIQWESHFLEGPRYSFREMYGRYQNNLRLVLYSVERLISQTEGRVVITADHGEGFGDCGVAWSHKGGFLPWLLEVPWFKVRR